MKITVSALLKISASALAIALAPAQQAMAETAFVYPGYPVDHDRAYGSDVSADGMILVVGGGHQEYDDDTEDFAWIWQPGLGYTMLAPLPSSGPTYSTPQAISGNGNVIVGEIAGSFGESSFDRHAVRWTTNGAIEDISAISGSSTIFRAAYGTNNDGNIIVGDTLGGGNNGTGFPIIWIAGIGAQIIEDSPDASGFARFTDVNNDATVIQGAAGPALSANTVVVGATKYRGNQGNPVAWRPTTGWELLSFSTPTSKGIANAVNNDGTVIVGAATQEAETSTRPFRWTQATGATYLEMPEGGSHGLATDVSGDGNVAVGTLSLTSGGVAALWTEDPQAAALNGLVYQQGYQTVTDWLVANGVTIAEGADLPTIARGTNEDGTVIIGNTQNSQPFYATARGFINPQAFAATLATVGVAGDMSLSSTNLVMHGAHSQPLLRRVGTGKFTAWTAGDYGRDDHGDHNGALGLVEVGAGYNFGPVQMNLSIGQTWSDQDLALNGEVSAQGQYVFLESSIALAPQTGLFLNFGGYGHWGDADITRGYTNAGNQQFSTANPDTQIYGLRARIDWFNINGDRDLPFSPYIDYSFTDAQMDSYTETGGGFPAMVGERSTQNSELRLGGNFSAQFGRLFKLLVNAELAHRLNDSDARSTGAVIGIGSFNMPGREYDQTWFKGGIGFDSLIGPARFNLMLNGTSEGEQANLWLASGLQFAF